VNLLFFLSYVLPHSRLGVRLLQKDVSTGHVPLLRVLVRVLLSVRLRLRQLLWLLLRRLLWLLLRRLLWLLLRLPLRLLLPPPNARPPL
jgi:hypothetical protein